MTIRHLKIFIQVYRLQNITRAARELNLTQPAVSRSILELEQHYGMRLFERLNHRLQPTEGGKRLYARAVHLLESFDLLEQEMKQWDETGVLRIGASVTLGNFLLPQAIAAFHARHPQLQLQCLVANGAQLQQALLENRLDLALIEGGVSTCDLIAEPLGTDRLMPVLPPGHPLCFKEEVDLEELLAHPLLLREPGSAGRTFFSHLFAVRGLSPVPALESISTQAIVQAVHTGLGISFLPEQLVMQDLMRGFVATCTVKGESFVRTNYIVYHKNKVLTSRLEELITLCRQLFLSTSEGESR